MPIILIHEVISNTANSELSPQPFISPILAQVLVTVSSRPEPKRSKWLLIKGEQQVHNWYNIIILYCVLKFQVNKAA